MTTETKTMTREELDEAIAELHEPKPCEPLFEDRSARSIFGYWEWSALCGKWFPRDYPSKNIFDAKRLTDELVKAKMRVEIQIFDDLTSVNIFQPGDDFNRVIRVLGKGEHHEELARSLAYYEAKTGVRVEIKEEG